MKQKSNKYIKIITYAMLILFAGMAVWLIYLVTFAREGIENNSYNKRIDSMEKYVVRGNIYAADMSVLATTNTNEDGSEVRYYPYENIFSHVVGYNCNGKFGIESQMNYYLLSSSDSELVYMLNEMVNKKSEGYDVVTSLDVKLQKAAYDALGDYDGAVVAMDVATGEVLAMVSKPDFDPNTIENDWNNIISDKENTSLLNRVTGGLYPPGSTFKTVTLLEYVKESGEYDKYLYNCTGTVNHEGSILSCIYKTSHGDVDLKTAFAKSCNCAFSTIGLKLNMKKWQSTCEKLLFNKEMFTAFECSQSKFSLNENSTVFDIMQTAMGQGTTLVTPMHNAMIAAAIANDGVLVKPHLVTKVLNEDGDVMENYENADTTRLMGSEESEILSEYMRAVVESGTAQGLNVEAYEAYGKTGSAQYDDDNLEAYHSWFMGYAKYSDRTIAICTVVEGVENGSTTGKTVAKKVLDAAQ